MILMFVTNVTRNAIYRMIEKSTNYLDFGFASSIHHPKWPMFHVSLNTRIVEVTSDKTFGIKYGVARVHGHLVFGGVTNQPFGVSKSHIGRCGTVSLKSKKVENKICGRSRKITNRHERLKLEQS